MSDVILLFCEPGARRAAHEVSGGLPTSFAETAAPSVQPAHMLAVGPEGGAALARWVAERGIDGVRGIGLVGVTAPWAERRASTVREFWRSPHETTTRLPLGPIEPLRAVAERARSGEPVERALVVGVGPEPAGRYRGTRYSLRFIVACAPDDGVCPSGGCGGRGWHYGPGFSRPKCERCSGTGKSLSSADVARELSGERRLYDGIDDFEATTGGMTTIHYPTRAALAEHGLRAVVAGLTR